MYARNGSSGQRDTYSGILLLLTLLLCQAPSASAHHSAAAFDPALEVEISGTVASLEWTSPHARLYVDEQREDGSIVHWNFELPSPVGLMRSGWRRSDLNPGDRVSVSGFRAKEHPDIAIAESVRDSEGKSLFAGK